MAILKVHYEGLDWYLYLYFIKSLGHHKNSLAIIIYVGETGFEFVMVMILNMFQLVHYTILKYGFYPDECFLFPCRQPLRLRCFSLEPSPWAFSLLCPFLPGANILQA